tara:strand:+ start:618 stop:806 length:189 start_codon:yes stop_codon:yes gene_type:complete
MEMLRLRDVTDILGVSARTVRLWVECGVLNAYKAHDRARNHYNRAEVMGIKARLSPEGEENE